MRLSSTMAAVVLGAALTGFAGAPALASGSTDRNCDDFSSQAEAQATLDADASDPDGLDRDDDGTACESTDYPTSSGETSGPGGEMSGTAEGAGSATGDRDCADFDSQAAAQAYYEDQAGDPDRLDRDADGQACEAYAYTDGEEGSVDDGDGPDQMAMPTGGVDTGAGGSADADLASLATGGGLLLAGAGGLVLARRRSAARG